MEAIEMRAEYDFSKAKPNPYIKKLRKQITIRIDTNTIESLKNDKNFLDATFRKALDYQLELIDKKDIEEHKMPG
jgi:hypothetical protein